MTNSTAAATRATVLVSDVVEYLKDFGFPAHLKDAVLDAHADAGELDQCLDLTADVVGEYQEDVDASLEWDSYQDDQEQSAGWAMQDKIDMYRNEY